MICSLCNKMLILAAECWYHRVYLQVANLFCELSLGTAHLQQIYQSFFIVYPILFTQANAKTAREPKHGSYGRSNLNNELYIMSTR